MAHVKLLLREHTKQIRITVNLAETEAGYVSNSSWVLERYSNTNLFDMFVSYVGKLRGFSFFCSCMHGGSVLTLFEDRES
jgi:hypothetical protein